MKKKNAAGSLLRYKRGKKRRHERAREGEREREREREREQQCSHNGQASTCFKAAMSSLAAAAAAATSSSSTSAAALEEHRGRGEKGRRLREKIREGEISVGGMKKRD